MKYKASEHIFTKEDGKHICGKLFLPNKKDGEREENYPLIIFSHGFGSNYRDLEHYGPLLAGWGIALFVFDFCGGGPECLSDGTMKEMSIHSETEDLHLILSEMKKIKDIDADRISLMGESLGGLVSAYVAFNRNEDVDRLILWYPAFSMPEDCKRDFKDKVPENVSRWGMPVSRAFIKQAMALQPYEVMKGYEKPVLILHGTNDAIVPIEYSRKAKEAFRDCRLVEIENGEHGFNGFQCLTVIRECYEFVMQA